VQLSFHVPNANIQSVSRNILPTRDNEYLFLFLSSGFIRRIQCAEFTYGTSFFAGSVKFPLQSTFPEFANFRQYLENRDDEQKKSFDDEQKMDHSGSADDEYVTYMICGDI
jgi:hypothetical protein